MRNPKIAIPMIITIIYSIVIAIFIFLGSYAKSTTILPLIIILLLVILAYFFALIAGICLIGLYGLFIYSSHNIIPLYLTALIGLPLAISGILFICMSLFKRQKA